MKRRAYVAYQGRACFLCGARCMLGSTPEGLFATILLIFAPISLFLIVAVDIKNYEYASLCGMLIFACGSLALTALKDPGIVPRRHPSLDVLLPKTASDEQLKFCATCNIYRPQRAKHCQYCDVCVKEFDHHCPWTGACIGLRNYRHFLQFILSVLLLSSLVLAFAVIRMTEGAPYSSGTWWRVVTGAVKASPWLFALALYSFLTFCCLFHLCVYHIRLQCHGLTTNEEVRNTYRDFPNPYNFGFMQNCRRVLCQAQPRSDLRLRQDISSEQSLFLTHPVVSRPKWVHCVCCAWTKEGSNKVRERSGRGSGDAHDLLLAPADDRGVSSSDDSSAQREYGAMADRSLVNRAT